MAEYTHNVYQPGRVVFICSISAMFSKTKEIVLDILLVLLYFPLSNRIGK